MSEFEKRYIIPSGKIGSVMRRLWDCLGKFNSQKVGRNRRGSIIMSNVSSSRRIDGSYDVIVEFQRGRPRYYRVVGEGRFPLYGFGDFTKLLRTLKGISVKECGE